MSMIRKRTTPERVTDRVTTLLMGTLVAVFCGGAVTLAGAPFWGALATSIIVGICFHVPLWVREELED